jgi:putative SOS response-associated peptidase YedK
VCYSILVRQDLERLQKELDASILRSQFDHYERMTIMDPKRFKPMSSRPRIYPNDFAPIVTSHQQKRWMIPMRYRIRPAGSKEEIPTQYNVFNARHDALLSRRTWSNLIGRQHGVVIIDEFYEWVASPQDARKKVLGFYPKDKSPMFTPVLWDWWESEDRAVSFFSFAVITGEPPEFIRSSGHDRCPLFLNPKDMDWWLSPGHTPTKELLDRLAISQTYDWSYREAHP